jgi:hypothetical protein
MKTIDAPPALLPLQWPQAAPSAMRRARSRERLLKAAIMAALISITVLDRFGLRVSDTASLPASFFALYALLAAMIVGGMAQLNPRGAAAYAAVMAVAGLSALANSFLDRYVSASSFLLLAVLYAPFSLTLGAAPRGLWRWTANAYIGVAVFVSAAGMAQFAAQFALHADWLFDYAIFIPEPIRAIQGYDVYPYSVVGGWYKSNGFFLREPSALSFLSAFAMLCELSLRRRWWVLAILAMALVLSYSGSGLLTLAVGLIFPLTGHALLRVVAAAVVALTVFATLGEALHLGYTVGRVGEFGEQGSSAYCRFVRPVEVVAEGMSSAAWTGLVGHGPGTTQMLPKCEDRAIPVETTYGKALFEYGLLGALAIGALMLSAINRSRAATGVRVALAVFWLLLGGLLLDPDAILLVYVLSGMWPAGIAAAEMQGGSA